MALPETKEGRKDLNTSIRRMDGVDSWPMVEIFALLLIKTRIRKDQKLIIKRHSAILTATFKICLKMFRTWGKWREE